MRHMVAPVKLSRFAIVVCVINSQSRAMDRDCGPPLFCTILCIKAARVVMLALGATIRQKFWLTRRQSVDRAIEVHHGCGATKRET
jgi:hypothetical protein